MTKPRCLLLDLIASHLRERPLGQICLTLTGKARGEADIHSLPDRLYALFSSRPLFDPAMVMHDVAEHEAFFPAHETLDRERGYRRQRHGMPES